MRVYDPYPDRVQANGREYRLNLAFHRVLRAMDIAEDGGLTAADKLAAQCAWLLAESEPLPETACEQAAVIRAVFELFPRRETESREKHIDFQQDAALIRSGFFRAYGIDLSRSDIHFLQFLELLADLPSDTALMRTIELRQRPIPKATKHNGEYIAALQRAKARVALKYTEEERQALFAESLKGVAL